MESQPHNPEFRNNPENFHPRILVERGVQRNLLDRWVNIWKWTDTNISDQTLHDRLQNKGFILGYIPVKE